ncbi:MAG: hypothetical protein ACJAVJ_000737, partial [Planctomycetota bacterium]
VLTGVVRVKRAKSSRPLVNGLLPSPQLPNFEEHNF